MGGAPVNTTTAPAWGPLQGLPKFRKTSDGQFTASCPAHDDRNPSLSIGIGADGKVLLTCFAGCSTDDIVAALGLTTADLMERQKQPISAGKTSSSKKSYTLTSADVVYDYCGDDGIIRYKVGRFQQPTPDDPHAKTFRPFRPDGHGKWELGLPTADQLVPYHLNELRSTSFDAPVLFLEGEKDVELARRAGFTATTTQGGAKSLDKHAAALAHALSRRLIVIIPDEDDPGSKYAQKAVAILQGVAAKVAILHLPRLTHTDDHGEDLSDWFTTYGGTTEELRGLIGAALQSVPTQALLGVPLSEVEVEEFRWLWHGRVALGKITAADGDPGLGKSLATIDLAARVSMGHSMPDGSPGLDAPAGVILICGEDGLADTVKPRLLAAGASPEALARIRAVNLVPELHADGTISERLISLLADLPALEATIIAIGARLLVIDPITAYLGSGQDMYKDSDIRRVLTPLALMAERAGVAVILVRHLNKSTSTPALHRGLGGVGFIGVARLGLLFAPNPDVEGEVLVSRHKGNIGAPPPTLAYRIVQVGEAENMPRISWLGERETSAEAALAAQTGAGADVEMRSATDEATEWLIAYLANGPRPAKEITDAARADRIIGTSDKPLRKARERLGIEAYREGGIAGGGRWVWLYVAPSGAEGHLRQNNATGQAAKSESNGAAPKMPTDADGGHLSIVKSSKMPSISEEGQLSTNHDFNGLGTAPEGSNPSKMPFLQVVGQEHSSCPQCGSSDLRTYGDELRCFGCDELIAREVG
jgi:putative DNA primase/helicase